MSLLLGPIYPQGAPPAGDPTLTDYSVSGWILAGFTIGNDGLLYEKINNTTSGGLLLGAWIDPQVGMNLYECRASQVGVKRASGIYDTWLDLANSWAWSVLVSRSIPTIIVSFLLEIRRKSDGVVVQSCTVTLEADGPGS